MQRYICLDVCDYTNTPLCNLYDSRNDISGQATDVFVHTERNGFKELKFKIPSEANDEPNYRLDFLVSDYRIRTREVHINNGAETVEIDWYLISEDRVTHSSFSKDVEVRASHISKLLNSKNLNLEFSDDEGNNVGTIEEIARTILEGTGWHLGVVAKFYEEDKYDLQGKEKVRSFSSPVKTGAFKMMSDLCEMFDAKPIYHGYGEYEEDGVVKHGRTVDILPMNPFSEKFEEGTIPQDMDTSKILELHYDKNVQELTRTMNTENISTVLYAYGSYGDLNGLASLQNGEHAEILFDTLTPGEYCFEHQNARYFFTIESNVSGMKWSSLDYASRSYLYDGTNLVKVYKEPKTNNYTTISVTPEYVKNYIPYIMDFSYYQKVGLFTDDMLLKVAQAQTTLPAQHIAAQEASLTLSDIKSELSRTASAGNGFLMLDIAGSDVINGHTQLTINKTTYSDGVIYRSDYDESPRNYFSWNTAVGIKDSGEAIAGKGAVVYTVHQGNSTKWEKSYVKMLGNGTDYYFRDSLGNTYAMHTEVHYADYDTFPVNGTKDIIYIADDTEKMYAWNGSYMEIQASGYFYGLNEFDSPTTITLWSTDDTWHSGDKVYLFSADSIAGVFGPREDAVLSNRKSVEESVKVSTETHPLYFIKDEEELPSVTACLEGYGWAYRSISSSAAFGTLYFCWGKNGEVGWSQVNVSNSDNNPELVTPTDNYVYSLKRMMCYISDNGVYRRLDDTVDEKEITKAFAAVVEGCINQEFLTKGVKERYNYADTLESLPAGGNYAFRNEYKNYWLFTTDMDIADPSKIHYIPATKILWQDDDEHHILKAVEHSFRYLDFPKSNELYDVTFTKGDYINYTFAPEGDKYISNNVYVHDNTNYKFNLPSGSKVVCLNTYQTVVGEFTTSPFTTPNSTSHVRVVCNSIPTNSHYLQVVDYNKVFFSKNKQYRILTCSGAGSRLGLSYLMNQFISLAHDAYQVKLPALQAAQDAIETTNYELAEYLGDIYREGYWQENDYVEGDENKLYLDALDNLKEISHPEATYDMKFIDLMESNNTVEDGVEVPWPDIDISYAAHLVDMDIDTNKWAYIDTIDKCYDQPWKTEITINTRLSMIGQQSFTDVLAKIAEVANETKAKQTIYSKAEVIGNAGQLAADKLEGLIQTNKIYLMGGTSNWYTDEKGNIIFEDADGNSAMMLTGRGLMVSNSRDEYGDWQWRTALSGKGFNADNISTGEFSAKHIIAGTITADKLSSGVGQELDIGSNKALNLYATADGSRPAGSLETQHPNPSDSWIRIAAQNGNTPASISIQSGGNVNLYGGSSMTIGTNGALNLTGATMNLTSNGKINIETGTSLEIKAGGKFLVDSENFKIQQDLTDPSKYNVTIVGNITTTGGKIAGFTIGSASGIDYMYAGGKTSLGATGTGIYIGTDGINIANKFKFSTNGNTATLDVNASDIKLGDVTGFTTLSGKLSDMDTKTGTAQTTANNAVSAASAAQTTADNIANGTTAVPYVETTGIKIYKDSSNKGHIDIGASGSISMAANSSLTFATSSSNSAFVLNNNGVSIGSGKSIAMTATGTISVKAANLLLGDVSGFANLGAKLSDMDTKTSTAQTTANNANTAAGNAQTTANSAVSAASAAQTTADNIANGTTAVPNVQTTGIHIYKGSDNKGHIEIGASGSITMAANSSLTFATSSSNSAFVLNNNGVSIGSAKSIALASGGTFTINSGNFKIKSDGTVELTGAVYATSGTFAGSLSAATGTFAGELSAATGSFKGSLSAATGTFKGELSAATGTFAGNLSAAGGTFKGELSAATGTFAGTLSAACITSGTMSAARISGGSIDATNVTITNLNASNITSGTMSASKISGGTLTLGGSNNTSGSLLIKNASGTEIGRWDNSGISATVGSIGGWTIGSNYLGNASTLAGSTIGMHITNTASDYVFWAGGAYNGTGDAAPKFRVLKDGSVFVTALNSVKEDGTTNSVNLSSYPLWKLSYATVKSITVGDTSLTISTTAGTYTANFNTAASFRLSGEWSGGKYVVDLLDKNGSVVPGKSIDSGNVTREKSNDAMNAELRSSSHATTCSIDDGDGDSIFMIQLDASGVYTDGFNADGVDIFTFNKSYLGSYVYSGTMGVTLKNGKTPSQSFQLNCPEAYNAGWNACIDACESGTYYWGGTYYSTLYVAPTGGATPISNCRAGQSSGTRYTIPDKK